MKNYLCSCYENYQGIKCQEEGIGYYINDQTNNKTLFLVSVEESTRPNIKQPPASTVSALATSINLTCGAEGRPTPIYQWYKDGVLIPREVQSFLYITETNPEDRGNYLCKAINSRGIRTSEQAQLDIPGMNILSMTNQCMLQMYTPLVYIHTYIHAHTLTHTAMYIRAYTHTLTNTHT